VAGLQVLAHYGHAGKPQAVLRPVKLGAALKLHRFARDFSAPQVQCSLQVDPIALALGSRLQAWVGHALDPGPRALSQAEEAHRPSQPTPAAGAAAQPGAAAAAVLDVRLSSVEASYIAEGRRRGGASAEEAHAHLSVCSGALALSFLPPGDVAAKVTRFSCAGWLLFPTTAAQLCARAWLPGYATHAAMCRCPDARRSTLPVWPSAT